jgi:hypothetical protein
VDSDLPAFHRHGAGAGSQDLLLETHLRPRLSRVSFARWLCLSGGLGWGVGTLFVANRERGGAVMDWGIYYS